MDTQSPQATRLDRIEEKIESIIGSNDFNRPRRRKTGGNGSKIFASIR